MRTARQVYAMLENNTLWQTAAHCHQLFTEAKVPYAVVGGVAVCLHGYRRNTVDLDLLIRREDVPAIRELLERENYRWHAEEAEFRSSADVAVQFLLAGDRAGDDSGVKLPDPSDAKSVTAIEGLQVLTLAKLIEAKIACGEGNLRRTHKDFADVIELIVANQLDGSFARFLHKSVRTAYRTLVKTSRGEG